MAARNKLLRVKMLYQYKIFRITGVIGVHGANTGEQLLVPTDERAADVFIHHSIASALQACGLIQTREGLIDQVIADHVISSATVPMRTVWAPSRHAVSTSSMFSIISVLTPKTFAPSAAWPRGVPLRRSWRI
jgi:hypothetical protein